MIRYSLNLLLFLLALSAHMLLPALTLAHNVNGLVSAEGAFPIPKMREPLVDLDPFEYTDVGAKIPNYPKSDQWGTQSEPMRMMQKPLSAAESLKHLVVPEGFRVELFAADPDLQGKPICMNWDERGRLWIAETSDYPNQLQPVGQGNDCIRICEDTDGDWKADKFTLFAEKLSIPTSFAFYRGGLIVQDGAQTVFLQDSDGDDVSDQRTIMFDQWNQKDTHGGVSNFQYGLDNWIWAMQGYNYSEPTIRGLKQQGFRMGFFRFLPDGSQIEFLRSTDNNTWGLGIGEDGQIFGSTANRNPSTHLAIPNRYYERVRGWTPSLTLHSIADTYLFEPVTDKVRQVDQHGGYTAAAGHALYTARQYPQEYWNRAAFVCGPTGHLVGTFVLSEHGSGFRSKYAFNLLASDDEWTAPIMAEVGPDGNIWVLDWYNFIVQHNPTPEGFETGKGNAYATDMRDQRHGRIYRIVYESAGNGPSAKLNRDNPAGLLAALRNPTFLWRRHAQRLLVERGQLDVVPALIQRIGDPSVDAIGMNTGVIHALWTLHGLGVIDTSHPCVLSAVRRALCHRSASVRRNAIQVLPTNEQSLAQPIGCQFLQDCDPKVRLSALLALAELPPTAAATAVLVQAFNDPHTFQDRWMADALTAAAARHAVLFLTAIQSAKVTSEASAKLLQTISHHYARCNPGEEAVKLIAAYGSSQPKQVGALLRGLADGWPAGETLTLSEELVGRLDQMAQQLSTNERTQLIRLANRWGSSRFEKYAQEVIQQLFEEIDTEELSDPVRCEAAQRLFEIQPDNRELVSQLLDRITPQFSPELAKGLINAIGESGATESGTLLVAKFPELTPQNRAAAIPVLLRREASTRALLDGIESGEVHLAELPLDQKQLLTQHPDPSLRQQALRVFQQGGALPNSDRQRVLDQWAEVAESQGDKTAGKKIFEQVCAKCHRHGSEGNQIGPDLTGVAVRSKSELMIHILDPNRSVESNFRTYTMVTVDGLVMTGILAGESKTTIELFNAEGEKQTILRQDIEELVASSSSLMPEGFEKQLSRTQMIDLLEFLTAMPQ
jgi:putative membrane-bound dehydrogenase-like protein